jgi:hypothetical protein
MPSKLLTIRLFLLTIGLFVAATFSSNALAQDCAPGDIVLGSQFEVDNFQLNHGPCDRMAGDLTIEGNDIVDLDGLAGLNDIFGDLTISHNPQLLEVDGLSGITVIGGTVLIWANILLQDLDGLTRLDTINGNLFIRDNSTLSDLDGLSRIVLVVGSLGIESNGNLSNLDGLNALTQVGGTFRLQTENLIDIDGLSRLSRVGGKLIISNTNLGDIDGLGGVSSVGGDLWILVNPRLMNLDGLSALTSAGSVLVQDNRLLADCQGLTRLIDPIDHAVPGPGPGAAGIPDIAGDALIRENQDGCNSILEILRDVEFFDINAGLNDAWFNPETPGQGYFIIVLPHLKQIFMAWFTYDTERPPADVTAILQEPGQRWMTAQGEFDGNSAVLTIFTSSGGVFDSSDPTVISVANGEILLEFTGCNSGTVTYNIPSIDRQGVVPIERIALDNVEQCYLLGNPLPDPE